MDETKTQRAVVNHPTPDFHPTILLHRRKTDDNMGGMFPRFLLSVILIAGAASVAEAGVILNDEGLGQGLDIAGALAAMDNESGDPIVRNSAPEDGLTVSLQPSSGGSGSVPLHLPVHHSGLDVVPTERISLEDSILPPTPDLDGLIKPPQVVSV